MTKAPIPVLPTVHYNMGGIPTNYWGEALNPDRGRPRPRLQPGLMAVGEAGCACVHGANRLGSNSLIDLVVFGRAAAIRAGKVVDRDAPNRPLNPASVDAAARPLRPRCATPTAAPRPPSSASRCSAPCRPTPRSSAPTRPSPRAARRWSEIAAKMADLKVTDRSMIWNSDLMETLELTNLMPNALATIVSAEARTGEPRRPAPARTCRTATT